MVVVGALALPAAGDEGIDALTPPEEGVLLGAWVRPSRFTEKHRLEAVEDLERRLGRRLDLNHSFYRFNQRFPSAMQDADRELGRISLISWGGIDTSAINRGEHDDVIRARAADLRAFGHPVMLRWFWEMDANENRPRARNPRAFIAAWRRIHDIMRSEGVTNVAWVWSPTAYGFETGEAPRWYPGDDYVDWIGADGFNWAPGRARRWRSFEDIFTAFHQWGTTIGKPMIIPAFGVQERGPGEKAQWFRDMRDAIAQRLTGIRALVYFDSAKAHDWSVDSTADSLAAFRDVAKAALMNTRPAATRLEVPVPLASGRSEAGAEHSPRSARRAVTVGILALLVLLILALVLGPGRRRGGGPSSPEADDEASREPARSHR